MCKSLPYSLFICIALLVSGCSRECLQRTEQLCELYAYTENDNYLSKTVLSEEDRQILWHNGDAISLLFGEQNSRFTCDVERDQPSAKFTGNLDVTSATASSILWAIYPYMSDVVLNNDTLTLTVPCHQTAVASSFDPSAMIMISKRSALDNTLYFNHLCGGLRFKVLDEGITEIIFEGHNEEPLAGTVEVICNDEGKPVVSRYINPEKSVSLKCESGFMKDTWYYISTLPGSLENGFSVTLYKGIDRMVYYSHKASIVKRSIFGQISQLDKGLAFENDWKKNGFIHRSFMLTVPQCLFDWECNSNRIKDIEGIRRELNGEVEVAQMFMNGPDPTPNINLLQEQMSIYNPDFSIIDYRTLFKDGVSAAEASRQTADLYGTVSGISINSYGGNNCYFTIDATLYFKKSGNYRVVALLAEENSSYRVHIRNGRYIWDVVAPDITWSVVSEITGDSIAVSQDNVVKYKRFKIDYLPPGKNIVINEAKVIVYVLRQYGDKPKIEDTKYGEWFVDNAFSARAGTRAGLPLRIELSSSIEPLEDYGKL